jgi:hypothetical protein
MAKLKKGKWSTDDVEKLTELAKAGTSLEALAETLQRPADTVKRKLRSLNLITNHMTDDERDMVKIRSELHQEHLWEQVQNVFSARELQYFESSWINMMRQFRSDVQPSEKIQIKQFITHEILINRVLRDKKRHIEEIDKIQEKIDKEYEKPLADRDSDYLGNLEGQITFMRSAIGAYTKEHTDLSKKLQEVGKDLKATRDQRIKRIDDARSTFTGLIRLLEDEDTKRQMGRDMEIRRIAKDQSVERLSEYHQYVDGMIDQPLLNSDTVKEE